MDRSALQQLLQDLVVRPRCKDWAARVELACETLWHALDSKNVYPDASNMVNQLIHLLQDHEAMGLARLVIPELRSHHGLTFSDPLKRKILECTEDARSNFVKIETTAQHDFDSPLYKAEKQVFTEAEMFRASLLLYGSAAFDEVQEKEILEWLSKRPTVYLAAN